MTVREALEKAAGIPKGPVPESDLPKLSTVKRLAPKIEAALRAAWEAGAHDEALMHSGQHSDFTSDRGVTAGTEAMQ